MNKGKHSVFSGLPIFLCLALLLGLLLTGCGTADDALPPEEQDLSKGYIRWEGDTAAPEEHRTKKILADPQKVLDVIALLRLDEQDFVPLSQAEKTYNHMFEKWKYMSDLQVVRCTEYAIMIVREDGMCAVYEYTANILHIDYSRIGSITLTEEENERFRKILGIGK